MRRSIGTRERVEIFRAHDGICHLCAGRIQAGEAWDLEHAIPLAMGGEDGGDNLRPAHVKCHRTKTSRDVRDIAKAKRREARHLGAHRAKRLIPGSKGTGFRKHLNGTVTKRQED